MKRTGVTTTVYLAASLLFAPHLSQAAVAPGDTFTGTKDSVFSSPENWLSGITPPEQGDYDLIFNPTPLNDGTYVLEFDRATQARSLSFRPGVNDLTFKSDSQSLLTLGTGGITTDLDNALASRRILLTAPLSLVADQNWVVGENTQLQIGTLQGQSSFSKGGLGTLVITDATQFTGSLLIQSGALKLLSGSQLGTLSLSFQSNSSLQSGDKETSLTNSLFLQNNVSLTNQLTGSQTSNLQLGGLVKTLDAQSVINLGTRLLTKITGTLDAPAGGSVTFAGTGRIELAGTVDPHVGSLVFTTTGGSLISSLLALPDGTGITVDPASTLGVLGNGTNNNELLARVLARITAPADFASLLSLESASGTSTYSGTLDLSPFTHTGFTLGTKTSALIAADAVLTAPAGGYRLGGGGGVLKVAAPLAGPVDLQVNSTPTSPTRLYLQGENTFTGALKASHSYVYLDAAKALPDGSPIQLGASGYVAYTPNWGATRAMSDLVSRITALDADGTSVIGFDATNQSGGSVTLSGTIDLSGLGPVYLGTTTKTALIDASADLKAPQDGVLRLAALRGSTLQVATNLGAAQGITSLVLGHPDSSLTSTKGRYSLTGSNTYAGGTQVINGVVEVSSTASSPFSQGTLSLTNATLQLGGPGASAKNHPLPNALVVDESSRITGSGRLLAPGGLTISNGAWIAPGYSGSKTNGEQLGLSLAVDSDLTFGPQGGYELMVLNPTGSAGTDYSTLSTAGKLDFSSTSLKRFNFKLISYSADGQKGALSGLSKDVTYQLVVASAGQGIQNFDMSVIKVDTSAFLTTGEALTGFHLDIQGTGGSSQQLILSFTPIPEPETWALMVGGAATLLLPLLRRRRS